VKTIVNTKNFFKISLLTITLTSVSIFVMELEQSPNSKFELQKSHLDIVTKIRKEMSRGFRGKEIRLDKRGSLKLLLSFPNFIKRHFEGILKQKYTKLPEEKKETIIANLSEFIKLAIERFGKLSSIDYFKNREKKEGKIFNTQIKREEKELFNIDKNITKKANNLDDILNDDWHKVVYEIMEGLDVMHPTAKYKS